MNKSDISFLCEVKDLESGYDTFELTRDALIAANVRKCCVYSYANSGASPQTLCENNYVWRWGISASMDGRVKVVPQDWNTCIIHTGTETRIYPQDFESPPSATRRLLVSASGKSLLAVPRLKLRWWAHILTWLPLALYLILFILMLVLPLHRAQWTVTDMVLLCTFLPGTCAIYQLETRLPKHIRHYTCYPPTARVYSLEGQDSRDITGLDNVAQAADHPEFDPACSLASVRYQLHPPRHFIKRADIDTADYEGICDLKQATGLPAKRRFVNVIAPQTMSHVQRSADGSRWAVFRAGYRLVKAPSISDESDHWERTHWDVRIYGNMTVAV